MTTPGPPRAATAAEIVQYGCAAVPEPESEQFAFPRST
jgi:hypothetical protein